MKVAPRDKPLAGIRIVIPPARPEANPLLNILERRGAEVVEFPGLTVAAPSEYGPMDEAIRELSEFDWIIFSGSNCVVNFFERLTDRGLDEAIFTRSKIGAIGHGAVAALKKEGAKIHYAPREHTAESVVSGLGKIRDQKFLLIRVEGASRSLPQRLKSLGAHVKEIVGYRMLVEATKEMAAHVFGQRLDVLALANPTAVRFLVKGSEKMGLNLQEYVKGIIVAVVGPATAEAARSRGLFPTIISQGHIADLAESLIGYFGT